MRARGVLRGPEFRLHVGGGDLRGAFTPVDGVPGLETALRSVIIVRAELAVGLQVELGPVTPWVQAIASAGGAFIDVAVRDERLGDLGTETIDTALLSAGFEVGLDVEVEEGASAGLLFRANLVGAPSLGGGFRFAWGGD